MLSANNVPGMYRWYKAAEVCFALIEDFEYEGCSTFASLSGCRWFTRGWTLQELLVPRKFEFYDKHWNKFGTRYSLALPLELITGIHSSFLYEMQP